MVELEVKNGITPEPTRQFLESDLEIARLSLVESIERRIIPKDYIRVQSEANSLRKKIQADIERINDKIVLIKDYLALLGINSITIKSVETYLASKEQDDFDNIQKNTLDALISYGGFPEDIKNPHGLSRYYIIPDPFSTSKPLSEFDVFKLKFGEIRSAQNVIEAIRKSNNDIHTFFSKSIDFSRTVSEQLSEWSLDSVSIFERINSYGKRMLDTSIDPLSIHNDLSADKSLIEGLQSLSDLIKGDIPERIQKRLVLERKYAPYARRLEKLESFSHLEKLLTTLYLITNPAFENSNYRGIDADSLIQEAAQVGSVELTKALNRLGRENISLRQNILTAMDKLAAVVDKAKPNNKEQPSATLQDSAFAVSDVDRVNSEKPVKSTPVSIKPLDVAVGSEVTDSTSLRTQLSKFYNDEKFVKKLIAEGLTARKFDDLISSLAEIVGDRERAESIIKINKGLFTRNEKDVYFKDLNDNKRIWETRLNSNEITIERIATQSELGRLITQVRSEERFQELVPKLMREGFDPIVCRVILQLGMRDGNRYFTGKYVASEASLIKNLHSRVKDYSRYEVAIRDTIDLLIRKEALIKPNKDQIKINTDDTGRDRPKSEVLIELIRWVLASSPTENSVHLAHLISPSNAKSSYSSPSKESPSHSINPAEIASTVQKMNAELGKLEDTSSKNRKYKEIINLLSKLGAISSYPERQGHDLVNVTLRAAELFNVASNTERVADSLRILEKICLTTQSGIDSCIRALDSKQEARKQLAFQTLVACLLKTSTVKATDDNSCGKLAKKITDFLDLTFSENKRSTFFEDFIGKISKSKVAWSSLREVLKPTALKQMPSLFFILDNRDDKLLDVSDTVLKDLTEWLSQAIININNDSERNSLFTQLVSVVDKKDRRIFELITASQNILLGAIHDGLKSASTS